MPGSEVPLVLRKTPNHDVYEFLGEAYVHGIMYGEVFDQQHEQLQTVTLR
jgi:hypothetical protein